MSDNLKEPKNKDSQLFSEPHMPNFHLKTILFVVLPIVVIAGIVITIILANNVFANKDKKNGKTGNGRIAETTVEYVNDPVNDPNNTSETTLTEAQKHVTQLKEISDVQMKKLQDAAEARFKEGDYETGPLPKEVTVDTFNYIGPILADWESEPAEALSIVFLNYQVIVTDNTGEEPVKRQFFWSVGYSEVFQDGYADTSGITTPSGAYLYFGKWTVRGFLHYSSIEKDIARDIEVIENQIDTSLIVPFDGETASVNVPRKPVLNTDDVSEEQIKAMRKAAKEQYEAFVTFDTNVHVDSFDYVGIAVVHSFEDDKSIVYPVFEAKVTDATEKEPVQRSFIWYMGFIDVYENGELDTSHFYPMELSIGFPNWTTEGVATVEEARRAILDGNFGYEYTDNFDGFMAGPEKLRGFIFPKSDVELIPEDVIKALSDEELRAAINEIWARHGYIFKNQELLEYYRQFDWYEEKITKEEWDKMGDAAFLNDVEKKNVDLMVKEREERRKAAS